MRRFSRRFIREQIGEWYLAALYAAAFGWAVFATLLAGRASAWLLRTVAG